MLVPCPVGISWVSILSLTPKGIPKRGPSGFILSNSEASRRGRSLFIKDQAPTSISHRSILAIHSDIISLGLITPDAICATESFALRQGEYPAILFLVRSEIVTSTKPPVEIFFLNPILDKNHNTYKI